jgi:hypothetical protein
MNRKFLAAVAPFALALPLAMAGPASAAPAPAPLGALRCSVDAHAVRGNQILVDVGVNGRAKGRQSLVLQVSDNGHVVARGPASGRLPFHDFAVIRNLRGPDFVTFSARDNTTGQRCSASTVVWK